jgi:hypothetical protein
MDLDHDKAEKVKEKVDVSKDGMKSKEKEETK